MSLNYLQLFAGALLGIFTSIILKAFNPAIEDGIHKWIVVILGKGKPNTKLSLKGNWVSRWYVQSNNYPPIIEDKNATIRQFGDSIVGATHIGNFKCIITGKIKQNHYITGEWRDDYGGGYFGTFQFIIDPSTGNFSGKWVGFSRNGTVKSGNWEWKRAKATDSSSMQKTV